MFFPQLMNIKASDLVLEIGPGAYPYWRSDCLADVFDETSDVDLTQFGGARQNTKGKPLFKIINGTLPFKDNSFDYVICSHVFEHVPVSGLGLLATEIMRVGKKAYVEFPRPLYDYIYNFAVHISLLDIVNGEIVCLDKKHTGLEAVKKFSEYSMLLRKKDEFSVDVFFPGVVAVGYEFTGSIPLSIMANEDEFWPPVFGNAYMLQPPSLLWRVVNKISLKRIQKSLFGEKQYQYFENRLK